jgi:L-ribulokinase
VLNRPIKIASSDQVPALGAAVYAAVAAGIYPDVITASGRMGSGFEAEYRPEQDKVAIFDKLLARYDELAGFMETVDQKIEDHEFQL